MCFVSPFRGWFFVRSPHGGIMSPIDPVCFLKKLFKNAIRFCPLPRSLVGFLVGGLFLPCPCLPSFFTSGSEGRAKARECLMMCFYCLSVIIIPKKWKIRVPLFRKKVAQSETWTMTVTITIGICILHSMVDSYMLITYQWKREEIVIVNYE